MFQHKHVLFLQTLQTQDWSLVWKTRTLNTTRECSTGSKKQIHDMQSNKNQQIVLDLESQPQAADLAMPGGSMQARHTWIKMHVPETQPVLAGLGWVQPQTDCLWPEAGNCYKTRCLSWSQESFPSSILPYTGSLPWLGRNFLLKLYRILLQVLWGQLNVTPDCFRGAELPYLHHKDGPWGL